MVEVPDIDEVDIVSPNYTHYLIAMAAAAFGWRPEKELSGGGTSIDAASHIIGTAEWLNGRITRCYGKC